MYLTPQEIAQARDNVLNSALSASATCLAAGERLTSLFSRSGQAALARGSQHFDRISEEGIGVALQAPSLFWLEHLAGQSTEFVEEMTEIFGDTHTAMLQLADAHIHVLDAVVFRSLDRAVRSSPIEGEIALSAIKTALASAEHALHGFTDASIQTVELGEEQVRQVTRRVVSKKSSAKGSTAK